MTKIPGTSSEALEAIRHRGRLRAARRSVVNQPSTRPGKVKRELTEPERRFEFRKQQRAAELRAIEDERRRRVANVDEWASGERAKVNAKYGDKPAVEREAA